MSWEFFVCDVLVYLFDVMLLIVIWKLICLLVYVFKSCLM